jgi:hypothetical protein
MVLVIMLAKVGPSASRLGQLARLVLEVGAPDRL